MPKTVIVFNEDVPGAMGHGDVEGYYTLTGNMATFDKDRIRLLNGVVIDAATVTTFYIDAGGTKHVVDAPGRQTMDCEWDDRLLNVDGVWVKG